MERYKDSKRQVEALQQSLSATQAELRQLNQQILALEANYSEIKRKQENLENEIKDCEKRLSLSTSLLSSLAGERLRWTDTTAKLDSNVKYLAGDTLLSAAIISYLGAFPPSNRYNLLKSFVEFFGESFILISPGFSLEGTLGEPMQVKKWVLSGLPSDGYSRENAMIVYASQKWPLLIDPQGQANKWIKNYEQPSLLVARQRRKEEEGGGRREEEGGGKRKEEGGGGGGRREEDGLIRALETGLGLGYPVLLENVGEELDGVLEPVLGRQFFKNGGVMSVKVGENVVEIAKGFRLLITTKMRNPHYQPELTTKVKKNRLKIKFFAANFLTQVFAYLKKKIHTK